MAVKIPLARRINFRILIFAAVVLTLIGFPIYWYLDIALTGGIHNRGEYYEVDLKAISSFNFNQESGTKEDIPRQWRDLDGKKIVAYGEMWAPYSAGTRLGGFDLVYSIAKCCFSGPPQVQHFVKARAVKGNLGYYNGLVRVKGTLHIDVKYESGKVVSVYQLDAEEVKPAS